MTICSKASIRLTDTATGFEATTTVKFENGHVVQVETTSLTCASYRLSTLNWQNYDGACFVLMKLKKRFRRLKVIFGDSAYGKNGVPEWVKETFGSIFHTVLRPVGAKGFVVLPKRWIVERTFAWIGRYRRTSKDYEKTIKSSEAMIQLAMITLMSKRLARK